MLRLHIFGSSRPEISFRVDPKHGTTISCKSNYVFDMDYLYYQVEEPGNAEWCTATWWELDQNTTPDLSRSGLYTDDDTLNRDGWDTFKETLLQIPEAGAEREFLSQYFGLTEKGILRQSSTGGDTALAIFSVALNVLHAPALIPQVWVNWIHYDSADKDRARRIKEEAFRVDFALIYQGRNIVIEIDGSSHFSEILYLDPNTDRFIYEPSLAKYTESVRKDRWLRRQGWEVWRFTDQEVLDDSFGALGILKEIGILRKKLR